MPHEIYELEFPFSYHIMDKIDDYKRMYEEELLSLYSEPAGTIDKDTGELYAYIVQDNDERFIKNIENIPIIRDSLIANYPELYFKDFINVILSNEVSRGMRKKE